jgi:hypothetical protein
MMVGSALLLDVKDDESWMPSRAVIACWLSMECGDLSPLLSKLFDH